MFRDVVQEVLPPDAALEPLDGLSPSQVAFWVKDEVGNKDVRYSRKSRDVYVDGENEEVQWFAVSESICERIVDTRSGWKYLGLGGPSPMPPDLHMPDKTPVKRLHSGEAYFVLTKEGKDVAEAVAERTSDATVRVLSERAAIVKNAMLIRQSPLLLQYTIDTLPNAVIPVAQARELYKKALDTILRKHAVLGDEHMTEEERVLIDNLTSFLRTCEWGTVENGMMYVETARRDGSQIGGAMFIVPRESQDQHTHFASRLEDGVPYLNIVNNDFTFPWAALGFAKQAAVLMNLGKLNGAQETRTQYLDNEREASQIEIALANILSKGMLKKAAKTIARSLKAEHTDGASFARAVDDLFRTDSEMNRITVSIDQCIEPQRPKSRAEMILRHGFHRLVVMFAVADEASEGSVHRANALKNEMIDFCYRDMGAGFKVPADKPAEPGAN